VILLILLAVPITVCEVGDMNPPDVDLGIGLAVGVTEFYNEGWCRIGPILTVDMNSDFSYPDWWGYGVFISREIRRGTVYGASIGRREEENPGWQLCFFIGVDL